MMIGTHALSINGKAKWPSLLLPMFSSSVLIRIERKNCSMRRRYAPNEAMSSVVSKKRLRHSNNRRCVGRWFVEAPSRSTARR